MPRAGSASAQAKSKYDSNPRRVCAQQQIPYRSDVGQTRYGPPRPEGEAKVITSIEDQLVIDKILQHLQAKGALPPHH